MPVWATSLLATFVGAAVALAGVWLQLREARRRESAAARAARLGLFGRVLALLNEFSPSRIERLGATADIGAVSEIMQTRESLRPLREELGTIAANEPEQSSAIFALLGAVSAYFECLPVVETGPEGKGFSLHPRVSNEDLSRLHERALEATTRAAAAYRG